MFRDSWIEGCEVRKNYLNEEYADFQRSEQRISVKESFLS
jgi:hypothetical protein